MDSELVGTTDFANSIRVLLKQGSTVQVLNLFTDNKHEAEVRQNSWDLIPIVANHLSDACEKTTPEVFKCCERLMDIIAEQSKPEEALLQFIEEIEAATDDTKFLMLVKPLQKVLLRIPDKRITSLAWCFNSIQHYLDQLETPEDQNLTSEEKLLLDCSPLVQRITFLYSELLQFCQVFVREFLSLDQKGEGERIYVIRKSLIQLLGKPLALLNMECYEDTEPQARRIAESLIEEILKVTPDPFIFLEMRDNTQNSDLMKPNDLSLGVMYYLLIFEEIGVSCTPKVYSPVYIVHNIMRLIIKLITEESEFAIIKGLDLTAGVFNNIGESELVYLLLDNKDHSIFCQSLSNIIVYNSNKDIRIRSLDVLHTYLWAFTHKGRYSLIYNLMDCITHSGLRGDLITQYKEMVRLQVEYLHSNNKGCPCRYYKGEKLFSLLQKFTFLKNKEETDLVDESDQIVSTLNFIRYLVLADKTGRYTDINKYLNTIQNNYFAYLSQGIRLARAHYELKLKELSHTDDNEQQKMDVDVSVNVLSGKELLQIPAEKKIEIVNMSLTTLDVIESLLTRVTSCLESRSCAS